MSGPYDDIIHLPHPVSRVHPHMSRQNRAAQFSPFAALTGYDDAIRETARLTDRRIELGEDEVEALDMKLHLLAQRMNDHPKVTITHYQPDGKKTGGAYVQAVGALKTIDDAQKVLVLMDGARIAIEDILDVTGELFDRLI